jgi:hypothetical protein
MAGAVAVLILGAGAAWMVWCRPGPPARWRFEHNTLIVRDQQDRDLWRNPFANTLNPRSMPVADRNNDGRNEVYLGGVNNGSSLQATLVVLDPDPFGGASIEEEPMMQ